MKWNEKGANHLWILELDRVKDEGMKEELKNKDERRLKPILEWKT